jgi:hypothetical protein
MSTLSDIRDLETRLHSHFLEWSDTPLQNELLYFLDEVQELHNDLDKRDVPNTGAYGLELNLRQRINLLGCRQSSKQIDIDIYDKPAGPDPKQGRLL